MTLSTQHYGRYASRKEFQNSMPSFYLGINGKVCVNLGLGNYHLYKAFISFRGFKKKL
jgi:hypothetical protein